MSSERGRFTGMVRIYLAQPGLEIDPWWGGEIFFVEGGEVGGGWRGGPSGGMEEIMRHWLETGPSLKMEHLGHGSSSMVFCFRVFSRIESVYALERMLDGV